MNPNTIGIIGGGLVLGTAVVGGGIALYLNRSGGTPVDQFVSNTFGRFDTDHDGSISHRESVFVHGPTGRVTYVNDRDVGVAGGYIEHRSDEARFHPTESVERAWAAAAGADGLASMQELHRAVSRFDSTGDGTLNGFEAWRAGKDMGVTRASVLRTTGNDHVSYRQPTVTVELQTR